MLRMSDSVGMIPWCLVMSARRVTSCSLNVAAAAMATEKFQTLKSVSVTVWTHANNLLP